MSTRYANSLLLVAVTILAACNDGFDIPEADQMEKASGDGQVATAGNRLEVPLSVLATAHDGTPVPREAVRWIVVEGSGAVVSDSITVTDGEGYAQAYLTLGPTAGAYGVNAVLDRNPESVVVTFGATAVEAPEITSATPSVFSGGEGITLHGSHLTDSTVVEFNGREAAVSSVSPSGDELVAVVPYCLVPGNVTVSARVGLSESSILAGTFLASTGTLGLGTGEYLSVDPRALGGCASFPAAGPAGAEYILAPQLVSGEPGDTLSFRLRGDSVITTVQLTSPPEKERPVHLRFDDFLRGLEAELAMRPRKPLSEPELQRAPIELDLQVGDRRRFRVCNKVTCRQQEDFPTITAAVRYIGDHALIYQDEDAPAGGLSDQDFQELGVLFDRDLYGVATRSFGSESDVDGDGHLVILLTPIVNGMTDTEDCSKSYVTGFFFPLDIDPTAYRDNRSNQAEIFYAIVPDPQGTVTCKHTVGRVKRIVPVTFIHEMQHMINYHQHVVLRAGNTENTWLNEAMSHMAEELGALHFESMGQLDRFSTFSLGDLFNAFEYLKDPSQHFLMYSEGTGTLEERGAGWLFLRWLADQFGADVLRRLSETSLTSTANVEAATGEPIPKLLTDWFLTNYVSDHPDLAEVPDRLSYKTWNLREVYAALYSQEPSLFDRQFPIRPTGYSGGSFDVSGGLKAGSGAFFRVVQGSGQAGFTVELLGEGGNPLAEDPATRLNVIRIR